MSQRTEIVRFVAAVACYADCTHLKDAEGLADTCLALMRLARQFWRFGNGIDELCGLASVLGAEVIGTQRSDRQLLLCWGKELESVRIPNGERGGER